LEQESLNGLRLTLENFLNQVIQDVPVAAREGADETGDVLLAPYGG
jgi:hypothetical protein